MLGNQIKRPRKERVGQCPVRVIALAWALFFFFVIPQPLSSTDAVMIFFFSSFLSYSGVPKDFVVGRSFFSLMSQQRI